MASHTAAIQSQILRAASAKPARSERSRLAAIRAALGTEHQQEAPLGELIAREPIPCDGCPHRDRCSRGEACLAFEVYLARPTQWQQAPRQPSAAIYGELFGEGIREAA